MGKNLVTSSNKLHNDVVSKLEYISEKGKESDLYPYLRSLFIAKGLEKVAINHGTSEQGKDLIFCEKSIISDKVYHSVIVKNRKASQNDFLPNGEVLRQIENSFCVPYETIDNESITISRVLVIFNGTISSESMRPYHAISPKDKNNTIIWSNKDLAEQFELYIKNEFLRPHKTIVLDTKYESLWKTVYNVQIQDEKGIPKTNIIIDKGKLEELQKESFKNRILKNIKRQISYLSHTASIKSLNYNQAKLAIQALEDIGLPISHMSDLWRKIQICLGSEASNSFELFQGKIEMLENPFKLSEENGVENKYENALKLAYSFQFSKLYDFLLVWEPREGVEWIQKRSTLLALFDIETAKVELENLLKEDIEDIEKFYTSELLSLLDYSVEYRSQREYYQAMGLSGLLSAKENIFSEIKEEGKSIKPYGNYSSSIKIGGQDNHLIFSLFFIQFLRKSGILLNVNMVNFVDWKEWYAVFKKLFEVFPYPIIFYSIQCSDSDISRRMWQDIAYSPKLTQCKENFLKMLFNAYHDGRTPVQYKKNIVGLISELFVAVPSKIWEDDFMKIWQDEIVPIRSNLEFDFTGLFSFAKSGVKFLEKSSNVYKIVESILKNLDQDPNVINIAISITYNLKMTDEALNPLKEVLEDFVNNISSVDEIILLCNIDYNHINLKLISKIIEFLDKKIEIPERFINTLIHLCKDDKQALNLLKKQVINHEGLFFNGIISDTKRTYASFIPISQIFEILKFSDVELEVVIKKMLDSFTTLKASRFYNDSDAMSKSSLFDFTSILHEMNAFVSKLPNIFKEKYNIQFNDIRLSFIEKFKCENLEEAICSEDPNIVHFGLMDVENLVFAVESAIKIENISTLIIDKIILRKSPHLEYTLGLLRLMLEKFFNTFDVSKNGSKIILILKLYANEDLTSIGLNFAIIHRELYAIAQILSLKGFQNSEIKYWLDMKTSKIYNEVLYKEPILSE